MVGLHKSLGPFFFPCEEFPVLGGSGDTVPEVRPRCDPGMGVPWFSMGPR